MSTLTAEQARAYAEAWIDAWCRRDIDRIVSHYAEDATFISPLAAKRTGSAKVQGREALRRYWSGARAYTIFVFTLDHILWDEARSELLIVYTRDVDGRRDRACELVCFGADGLVRHGEAMYGAELEA